MVPLSKVFNRTINITEQPSCRTTANIKPGRRINNHTLKNAVTHTQKKKKKKKLITAHNPEAKYQTTRYQQVSLRAPLL